MAMLSRAALGFVGAAALLLVACGDDGTTAADGTGSKLSQAEFIAAADRICADVASRFVELDDPDGEGGAKPIGLGGFVRDWATELRTLTAPASVADDWLAALDLLEESADKLDQAEAGDVAAQSEALFDLQARAQQHIDAMGVPFEVCFIE